ncbi:aminotransferase class V-fold PLP-dependent enzyme, partial [bacterium]|nr:aminotransferase class V-fold PLP-dependent enzyme [bacterium]
AAQAAGKIPLDVDAMGVDLLSLSAHKLYGPKGVGALYLRRREPRVRIEPQLHGGGHEKGLRSGTLNVPGIVGFGAAAAIAAAELETEAARLRELRDELYEGLRARLDGVQLNGAREPRLAGNLNLSFAGVDADGLLMRLRTIALSSASACSTASESPSHVLAAMGLDAARAAGALRFSLGRFTTGEEIAATIAAVAAAVRELRAADPRRLTLDTLEHARSGLA